MNLCAPLLRCASPSYASGDLGYWYQEVGPAENLPVNPRGVAG
jgi:hypothetical protein